MPVPTTIDQLSTTSASNYPQGTDSPSTLDDVQRAHGSFIAKVRDLVGLVTGTYVPATAITNMGLTPAALGAAPIASPVFTGTVTAPAFSGPLTGSVTGNVTGNVTGSAGSASTASTASACSGNSATATALTTASGSAPSYGARAWCVFDGTLTGTNAPASGGNVSSVTRNSTGNYTINFTTALPSTAYAVVGSGTATGGDGNARSIEVYTSTVQGQSPTLKSTSQVQILFNGSGGVLDCSSISAMILG